MPCCQTPSLESVLSALYPSGQPAPGFEFEPEGQLPPTPLLNCPTAKEMFWQSAPLPNGFM